MVKAEPELASEIAELRVCEAAAGCWGRFCANRKPETVLRCPVSAFHACTDATREKPRTVQGQTAVKTGSGKSADLWGASERAKAIWIRSAHLDAGRRQSSMHRINRPSARKCLNRRPELDKEKSRVAESVHT